MSDQKIIFGSPTAFKSRTPAAANWVFRVVFLLTLAAGIIIAGEPHIPDDVKVRIFLYMKGFDVFIWGIGRGFGIKKADYEQEQK